MLVGDVAGLLMPVTGEGIGNGMLSSILATESINQALQLDTLAMPLYSSKLTPLIEKIRATFPWFKRIEESAKNNPRNLPPTVRDAYLDTLQNF